MSYTRHMTGIYSFLLFLWLIPAGCRDWQSDAVGCWGPDILTNREQELPPAWFPLGNSETAHNCIRSSPDPGGSGGGAISQLCTCIAWVEIVANLDGVQRRLVKFKEERSIMSCDPLGLRRASMISSRIPLNAQLLKRKEGVLSSRLPWGIQLAPVGNNTCLLWSSTTGR